MEKNKNDEDEDPFFCQSQNYSNIFPFYNEEDQHPIFGEIDFNFENSNINTESLVDSKKILNKLDKL